MLVDQAERSAKQVDPRRNDWRPDTGIVQDEWLDEVIDVAAVVGGVDHSIPRRRVDRRRRVLADAFDLSQNRVEGIFERSIQLVALCRAQLFEIRDDSLASSLSREPVATFQITCDFVSGQNGLGDFVHQST